MTSGSRYNLMSFGKWFESWFFPNVRIQKWNNALKMWGDVIETYSVIGATKIIYKKMKSWGKHSTNWRIIDQKGRYFYIRSSHLK